MTKLTLFLSLIITLAGCGPNQRILRSAESPTPGVNSAPVLSNFEQEVKAMRTANFNFIYVFRRKDAAPLDAADKKFAADHIPMEINRRKVIDDGKAIIIGSNFRLSPADEKATAERFAVEDYSKPESEIIEANANSNSNR